MSEIKVVKATSKDTEKIGNIAYQVALIHYKRVKKEFKKPTLENQTEYIRESIADKDVLVLKAKISGEIVGYIVVYFNTYPDKYFKFNKRAFIGSIGVDEKHQRMGIGQELLTAVEKEAKNRNISVVEVDYYSFNKSAEGLYKSCGYEEKKRYLGKFLG